MPRRQISPAESTPPLLVSLQCFSASRPHQSFVGQDFPRHLLHHKILKTTRVTSALPDGSFQHEGENQHNGEISRVNKCQRFFKGVLRRLPRGSRRSHRTALRPAALRSSRDMAEKICCFSVLLGTAFLDCVSEQRWRMTSLRRVFWWCYDDGWRFGNFSFLFLHSGPQRR